LGIGTRYKSLLCLKLPDPVIANSAELFGCDKGLRKRSATDFGRFEAAERGTRFLNEIGEPPMKT